LSGRSKIAGFGYAGETLKVDLSGGNISRLLSACAYDPEKTASYISRALWRAVAGRSAVKARGYNNLKFSGQLAFARQDAYFVLLVKNPGKEIHRADDALGYPSPP
jgi:hypothetical protein